jgi:hypothetical protein
MLSSAPLTCHKRSHKALTMVRETSRRVRKKNLGQARPAFGPERKSQTHQRSVTKGAHLAKVTTVTFSGSRGAVPGSALCAYTD